MTPAHAQKMAPGAAPGTSYQGSTAPDWSQGNPGYPSANYAPQANQGMGTTWSQGNYGGGSANYAPQPYQGNMSSYPAGAGGTEVITNGPQGSPPSNWSAQQNVRESQRYDRLLETNRGFREARMRRECGPIMDPQLHQQCVASFGQDEPYSGSSSSRRHTRSDMGR
jgi:hypothetical protein